MAAFVTGITLASISRAGGASPAPSHGDAPAPVAAAAKSDAELVAASLAGSHEAFRQIVDRYRGMICGVIYSDCGDLGVSEDVGQETFLAAWRDLPNLREPAKLAGWLRGIARHRAKDLRRKAARDPVGVAQPLDAAAGLPASQPTPMQAVAAREQQALVWRALEGIEEPYRETMVLFHREQRSVAAVAAAMEVSEDAVKQRLVRGRAMLRGQLARLVDETLANTAPDERFSLGVLAALRVAPGLAATGGAAAGWGGYGAGVGLSGGPLVSVVWGLVASWRSINEARTPRQRRLKVWVNILLWAYVLAFNLALLGMWMVWPRWFTGAGGGVNLVTASILFVVGLVGGLGVGGGVQRQIAREEGTDLTSPTVALGWRPQRLGVLAASIAGGLAWVVGTSGGAGDWAGAALMAGAGLLLFMAGAGVLRRRRIVAPRVVYLWTWVGIVAINAAAINLRLTDWGGGAGGGDYHAAGLPLPVWDINVLLVIVVVAVAVVCRQTSQARH